MMRSQVSCSSFPALLSHAAKILGIESYHSDRFEVGFRLDYRAEAPTHAAYPHRAARQLPDQSTTLRVDSSSTDDARFRGALPIPDSCTAAEWPSHGDANNIAYPAQNTTGLTYLPCKVEIYSISASIRTRIRDSLISLESTLPGYFSSRMYSSPHTGMSLVPWAITSILPSIVS